MVFSIIAAPFSGSIKKRKAGTASRPRIHRPCLHALFEDDEGVGFAADPHRIGVDKGQGTGQEFHLAGKGNEGIAADCDHGHVLVLEGVDGRYGVAFGVLKAA